MTITIANGISIDERDIHERFVRASGPGGQNVNKVATAVEVRFDVARSSLPAEVKGRLAAIAGSRLSADGVLVVDSREHRTQARNRAAGRERLIALIRQAARRPKKRRATRPPAAAKEKRLQSKRRRAAMKALRGHASED